MLIDPFTVAAQLVNFLILVALLRYFLYGRILEAMDAREERIRRRLEEAEEKRREAEEQARAYERDRRQLEREWDEVLAEARREAESRQKDLSEEALATLEAKRRKWQESLEREKSDFLRELRLRSASQVLQIVRKTLAELAGAELEERVLARFEEKLRSIPAEVRESFADAIRRNRGRLSVRTAFALTSEAAREIEGLLQRELGLELDVELETDAALVCGIEVRSSDHSIGWNVAEYLTALEEDVAARLSFGEEPEPAAPVQARES